MRLQKSKQNINVFELAELVLENPFFQFHSEVLGAAWS